MRLAETGRQTSRSYSPTAKLLHWAFIGVFAYGVINQVDEVEELEEFSLLISEVIFTLLFLTVLVFRFAGMVGGGGGGGGGNMSVPLLLLARTVHLGIYASLTMIAITGLLIGGLYHSGMKTGFLLETVLLSHEIFFWVSINLMGLHIAGAVYHRLKGDGVWSAMVPIFKEKV